MKRNLLSISLSLLLLLSLSSCTEPPSVTAGLTEESDTQATVSSVILKQTEDRGQEYLDRFIFFGESTTYHLKNRGVLSGGTDTKQVWGPDNGTVNLDTAIRSLRIRYPETGEYLTVGEALRRKKPAYLLLCFGLNGAVQKVRQGEAYYKDCYRLLLDEVRAASPDTKILLQACYPVSANMDMSRYTCTVDELNGYIRTINGWTLELAEEYGIRYLDTAALLADSDGFLRSEYQNGDGHHLTTAAYEAVLHYIRTHGYQ
ncbi:MAG: hypothetical protein E7668_03050 [Ruminococcaceae bacterium]|nr:hypothetical protein [Oscillospiraceae bacterium]